VLHFTRPIVLPTVSLPPAKPTLAVLAVGGAVALGGVLWARTNGRRKRDLVAR
jgi:hypothetical protein